MRKFYYFSKTKLKFVEIRNFYKKFVFLIVFFSVLISFFLFGTFLVFNEFINPDSEVKSLRKINTQLKEQFDQMYEKYQALDKRIIALSEKSRELRLAANLEPKESDDLYGTGGEAFTPIKNSTPSEISNKLDELTSYINRVSQKISLEKNSYEEIENTFKANEKLYSSLPAIKPCTGRLADDFGMRLHPILKIRRMHNGVDIITDVGTKIYAPGGGVVEFAGRRGGFGVTLEIDHGFGYKTIYAHLSSIVVKQGQIIKRGNLVAYSGNTGSLTTGPHLHYEVRHEGIALNPSNFIYDDVDLFEIAKK